MKYVICFLVLITEAYALVPIEGLIFGNVSNINQYDPFEGMLNFNKTYQQSDRAEYIKLKLYQGILKEGESLVNSCEFSERLNYSSEWTKLSAAKSVASTLQYIGLGLTVKAIGAYSKKIQMSDEEYDSLVNNLISNTCSQNLSVYSLKLLKDNLLSERGEDKGFFLPSISQSSYFSNNMKNGQSELSTIKKEFNQTLKNFRAFCSWNSDPLNFRLLVPYLKNPFIMTIIRNQLDGVRLNINPKTLEVEKIASNSTSMVACENTVCRKRSKEAFMKLYPLRLGSEKIKDDLDGLYCEFFSRLRLKKTGVTVVDKWIDNQNFIDSKLGPLNFIALYTGVPEVINMSDNLSDIKLHFKNEIKEKWDHWANKKVNQLYFDQMYEEPLEIELISQVETENIRNGDFNIKIDIGLSEIDRVLQGVDKLKANINLEYPAKYLAYLNQEIAYAYNNSQYKKVKEIEARFTDYTKELLNKKKKYFFKAQWSDELSLRISNEILLQINKYQGGRLSKLSKGFVNIPIEFSYGLFALQYLHKKHEFSIKEQRALTFR